MRAERDYVLGTEDDEIARLGQQHGVWRQIAVQAWRRAGIANGSRVVDVGAGPGHATLDLAQLVGPDGFVVAVERSDRFTSFLRAELQRRGMSNVRVDEVDLSIGEIDARGFDAAWCRWVACFVPFPDRLVRAIGASLRRGGVAIFHEYVDYGAWRLLPPRPAVDRFVAQVMASWRADGGEPDIARSLPALLRDAGFRIVDARPLVYVLSPADEMWRWPAGFVRGGARRLRALGRVSAEWVDDVVREIDEAEADAGSLMVTPMVLEIVAERARS